MGAVLLHVKINKFVFYVSSITNCTLKQYLLLQIKATKLRIKLISHKVYPIRHTQTGLPTVRIWYGQSVYWKVCSSPVRTKPKTAKCPHIPQKTRCP
jgi:hypothetical protein